MMKDKLEIARQMNLSKMIRQISTDLDKYRPSAASKSNSNETKEFAETQEDKLTRDELELDVQTVESDLREDLSNQMLQDFCEDLVSETQDISNFNKYRTKEFQPFKKRSSNGDSLQDILRADDTTK